MSEVQQLTQLQQLDLHQNKCVDTDGFVGTVCGWIRGLRFLNNKPTEMNTKAKAKFENREKFRSTASVKRHPQQAQAKNENKEKTTAEQPPQRDDTYQAQDAPTDKPTPAEPSTGNAPTTATKQQSKKRKVIVRKVKKVKKPKTEAEEDGKQPMAKKEGKKKILNTQSWDPVPTSKTKPKYEPVVEKESDLFHLTPKKTVASGMRKLEKHKPKPPAKQVKKSNAILSALGSEVVGGW
eukprot:TRINITY_DN47570_c0_g2_i1.p1 TRINITY_DN47570_c0_g2~~TRINITY_DN47570_c0_g2_i1.p1  ORF type:complete len:247 (-),score=59.15 TRINITY_DN47570_c0_g2_i1:79-789(-)